MQDNQEVQEIEQGQEVQEISFYIPDGSDIDTFNVVWEFWGKAIPDRVRNNFSVIWACINDAAIKEGVPAADLMREFLSGNFNKNGYPTNKRYRAIVERAEGKAGLVYQEKNITPFVNMPSGEVLNLVYRIFATKNEKNKAVEDLRHLENRKKDRYEKIEIYRKDDTYFFQKTKKESVVVVGVDDAETILRKDNVPFLKMLLFTLQKMTEQNFPLEIGFPLSEIVDVGIYSNTNNARRAFQNFFDQQTKITLRGKITKEGRRNKKIFVEEEGGILFYHYKIKNNYVRLWVNENLNMEFIAPYFMMFPRFFYGLSNNAFSLGYYIFYLARQNTKSIKEKGTFTINLDLIRDRMGLPTVEETRRGGRKYREWIRNPIERAIDEIEQAALNIPEAQDLNFTITPYIKDTETNDINEWLEGYLEIGLKGDFAESFIKIAEKQEEDIKTFKRLKTAEKAKIAAKKEM